MTTHYYIKFKERQVNQPDYCIGKLEEGKAFQFFSIPENNSYNTPNLTTKQEWLEFIFLCDDLLVDEHDRTISFIDFVNIINKSKFLPKIMTNINDEVYINDDFLFYKMITK